MKPTRIFIYIINDNLFRTESLNFDINGVDFDEIKTYAEKISGKIMKTMKKVEKTTTIKNLE